MDVTQAMKRLPLLAIAGVCLLHSAVLAQEHGPNDSDPRPLEFAYGTSGLAKLDREAMRTLQAKAASAPQKWHFDFMLYGLFGTVDGDVTVRGHEVGVDIGTQQVFDHLQFTMAGRAHLGYERWFAAVDVMYLGLAGSTDEPPVDMTFDQWMVQPTIGFSLSDHLDAFAGARYNQLNVDAVFQGPLGMQESGLQAWWDPIIGGIWKGRMSEHFGYQIYVDIGGFGVGSEFTTKLEPMISWYFSKNASLDLAYQGYYVDYEDTSEGFAYDTWTYGPLLGISVHF